MDDLSGRLQSLLSDPESLRELSELADMLKQSGGGEPEGDGQPDDADGTEMPDLTKLLAAGQLLSAAQQDENTALLLALKPHLSEARQKKVGRAVQMLRLWNAASVLRENGLLGELFGGP